MKTLQTISDTSYTTASETSSLSSSSPTFQVYKKEIDDDVQYKESYVDERLLSILIHQDDDNDGNYEKPTTHNNHHHHHQHHPKRPMPMPQQATQQ
mmetsp:Transcript_7749/g.10808  ORF Transcript_7749/g.10808 Transcript_7749/m.10808 type:complete len:96 (+) Transcript_7749:54-341(+)